MGAAPLPRSPQPEHSKPKAAPLPRSPQPEHPKPKAAPLPRCSQPEHPKPNAAPLPRTFHPVVPKSNRVVQAKAVDPMPGMSPLRPWRPRREVLPCNLEDMADSKKQIVAAVLSKNDVNLKYLQCLVDCTVEFDRNDLTFNVSAKNALARSSQSEHPKPKAVPLPRCSQPEHPKPNAAPLPRTFHPVVPKSNRVVQAKAGQK